MRAADLAQTYRQSINPPYKRKDLISILGTLFILLAIPLTVFVAVKVRPWGPRAAGTAASPTTIGSVIEPGSMVTEANYIIFIDGSNYYAKNGRTGEIQYSGIDAATVINTAINALPSGGKIELKEGTFNISSQINVSKANITLVGQGAGATIIAPTAAINGTAIFTNQEYVTFADFTLDCTNQAGGRGLETQANYTSFERLKIINAKDNAIFAAYHHHKVIDSVFQGGSGIMFQTSGYHLAKGNHFLDLGSDAIGCACKHSNITGNTFRNIKGCGVTFPPYNTGTGEESTDNLVSNNIFEGGSGDAPAIHMVGQDRISAIGNIIRNWQGNGIDTAGGANGAIIESNHISKIPSPSEGRGILFVGSGIIVSNNFVELADLEGIVGDCDHCTISGNVAKNNGQGEGRDRGIQLDGTSTYNIVTGNRSFDDQATKTQGYGFFMEGGTGVDYNYIADNDFRGNKIAGYGHQTVGSHNVFKNNQGYVTENSGTATITKNGAFIDVTHGLATIPTRVLVTPTTDTCGKWYWVLNKNVGGTDTKFQISLNESCTTADIQFDWRALIE